MTKCPECGAENKDGQKFCGNCGAKLPQEQRCPECGASVPLGQKFCGDCGAKLGEGAKAAKPAKPTVAAKPAPKAESEAAPDEPKPDEPLSRIEQINFDKAEKLVKSGKDLAEAAKLLEPVYASHKRNKAVAELYLEALQNIDLDKAYDVAQGLGYESNTAPFVKAKYYLSKNDLTQAERALAALKERCGDSFEANAVEAEYLRNLYTATKDEGVQKEYEQLLKRMEGQAKEDAAKAGLVEYLKPKERKHMLKKVVECGFCELAGLISRVNEDTTFKVSGAGGNDLEAVKSALDSLDVKRKGVITGRLISDGAKFKVELDLEDVSGITQIGKNAFKDCDALASIVIPYGVTQIGDSAFIHCSSLASVTIPPSVTQIGGSAFAGCSSLASVAIPASVTQIGEDAFNCSSLASVVIPASVTQIGDRAFFYCSSLASVVIPYGVTQIGDSAFDGCKSLASVTIPPSVTQIGDSAFDGCKSLASVTIPPSVTQIGDRAFYECSSLASVTIPEGVTQIGKSAFSWCSSLASVAIPASVTQIGECAFRNCAFAEGFKAQAAGWSFEGCLAVKDGVCYCTNANAKSIAIPEGVTQIGDSAFNYCSSLASVVIPASVTQIGDYAFRGSSLASAIVPTKATVGNEAFPDGCRVIRKDVSGKVCPGCGKPLKASAKFCSGCGKKL